MEVRKWQKRTDLALRKRPFQRVVRDIAPNYLCDVRFSPDALEALQEAAEAYLVEVFQNAQVLAIHAKRVTVMQNDIRIAHNVLRGNIQSN